MADKKISELTELVTPAAGDWFAIVDISAGPAETKKISLSNLVPVKATGAEIDTGTDDAKFATPKAITDSQLSFIEAYETLKNKKVEIDDLPPTDEFTGLSFPQWVTEAFTLGQIGRINAGGSMVKADASVIGTSSAIAIATAAMSQYSTGIFLLKGVIWLYTMEPGWTPGGLLYLSTTAGGMTQTPPSGADEVIQILGVAIDTNVLYFNPQLVQVEHT